MFIFYVAVNLGLYMCACDMCTSVCTRVPVHVEKRTLNVLFYPSLPYSFE